MNLYSQSIGKNGIVMVAGVPHLNCKSCGGLQPDHGSGSHDAWAAAAKQGVPFELPADHPLVVTKSTAAGSTKPTLPSSAGTVATAGTSLSTLTDASADDIISRSSLEQNIREVERTSTDPNVAATCTLFRNLLLIR